MFQRVLISTIQWCQIENTCLYMCGHTMGDAGGFQGFQKVVREMYFVCVCNFKLDQL